MGESLLGQIHQQLGVIQLYEVLCLPRPRRWRTLEVVVAREIRWQRGPTTAKALLQRHNYPDYRNK